jgi:hypothetical protein
VFLLGLKQLGSTYQVPSTWWLLMFTNHVHPSSIYHY